MTFSGLRVATGTTSRRGLRNGLVIPTIVGVTTGNAFGTTFTITPPAGSVGDLIVAVYVRDGGQEPAFAQTSGETLAVLWDRSISGTSSCATEGSWRIRDGSDTTYGFTGWNEWNGWICYAISGHDPTTPILDFSELVGGSGTSFIVPAVESDITNCLLLHIAGAGGGLASALTPPANDGVDHASHKFGGSSGAIHCAVHENHPNGGGTGTRTWGINHSTETRHGALLLIAPIEGDPDKLEFESTTDNLLFEDSSGVLLLE